MYDRIASNIHALPSAGIRIPAVGLRHKFILSRRIAKVK
jgi:hypothetical protein